MATEVNNNFASRATALVIGFVIGAIFTSLIFVSSYTSKIYHMSHQKYRLSPDQIITITNGKSDTVYVYTFE